MLGAVTSEELMRRGRSEGPVVVAGDDPRMSEGIAVLGHSDRGHPAVESLRRAEAWVRELVDAGCAAVVGPISLDLALSDAARRAKGAEDLPEIGIVLAPDIVVGNVLYKALM